MKKLIGIFIFMALIASILLADEPRYQSEFFSKSHRYALVLLETPHQLFTKNQKPEEWLLMDTVTGKKVYTITENLSSFRVLISDTGENIIALDDYGIIPDKAVVLRFYRNGGQIKNYQLANLLQDVSNISLSASHFSWLFPEYSTLNDQTFSLKTYELKTYEFNINTGIITKATIDPMIKDHTIFAYGIINNLSEKRYSFDIQQLIYGKPDSKIIFIESDEVRKFDKNQYTTLIIENGKIVTIFNNLLFNLCTYQKKN